MSLLNNNRKTNLLFRQFVGTGNALLPENSNFTNEPLKNINFVFNTEIQNQEVPLTLPNELRISQLDICSNIPSDSSFNLAAYGYPQLTFYKDIPLDPVPGAASQVWFKYIDISANPLTNQSNNLLIGMIPFKFDDINVLDPTYLPIVKRNFAVPPLTNFVNVGAPNNTPLYWIQNANNGLIQFYASTPTLNANNIQDITSGGVQDVTKAPTLSFYKYTGTFGTNVGSGSGGNVDSSAINLKFDKLNRMILPDGFVDISGSNYDLCGNETVRTYYTYNRAKMFIGYDNLPILDGSAVDHTQDPSHNDFSGLGQRYQLDVSGTIYFSNNIIQSSSFAGGTNSAAFGSLNFAGSQNAFAIGLGNEANGVRSFAYGQETTANGTNSCSQGLFTNAVGENSHSEGISTNARGRGSHSEGLQTDASGTESHAEGILTKAYGNWSHAEGGESEAHNPYSHASGRHTIIASDAGTSIGKYNDASQNILFVIGDGTSDTSRSDALIVHVDGNLSIFNDISMNGGQITFIADATDNSGVPSWGQVQNLITSGAGSYWIQSGTNLYYNIGNVGIGNTNPQNTLDVNGDANLSLNAFISQSQNQSVVSTDKNLYTRNTNLIDTLKINFDIFFDEIWKPMIKANENGGYTNPTTGQQYTLSSQNPGKPQAVPTFASSWGPCVIPIAYLDINQNYNQFPFEPTSGQSYQTPYRPDIANASAYFTIKFSEPYDTGNVGFPPIDWKTATLYQQNGGSFKSGLGAITQQTITFEAGYIDSYRLSAPNGSSADVRNPKPFIKVISTNIGNLKCLTGITVRPNPINPSNPTDPANINDLTQNMQYYGFNIETPKIGGICRIIIAESCPGVPADKSIQNKAWLLLEQQWNMEPWQGSTASDNEKLIRGLVGHHIIDVRMYANNLGDLNLSRNPPFTNEYNTDWQLVTPKQLLSTGDYSWDKFVLPMGNFANPPVFNTPTGPPVTDIPYTLMVGGTLCPNPTTGILDGIYPTIIEGANLWEVWLNLIDWPYGITTTQEVFENNVDICGTTNAQAIFATDITCNNLDALNSIDVGASQQLTIIEDKITSTTSASNPLNGLKIEANNIYIKFNPWISAGGATPAGVTMDLGDSTSNTQFRIRDVIGTKLFSVEGSGLMQTQNIYPFTNMTYNIGYKGANPIQDLRYKNFYVGNLDTSGNADINGDINVSGSYGDISATNIDVSNNLNVEGDTLVTDLLATNIDVSNNLNVEGLITGVAETTFVEYRDYTQDICSNIGNWYCIARTKDSNSSGGADNARGLFILDDNTSGRRQQIIFYAGTSYSRGNYINVIANNWYGSSPTITNLKLEVDGIYTGTNLYIYRQSTTVADRVYVRLYENTRISNTGGQWELTATPIPGLTTIPVNLDLTYNPNNDRANSVSSLDTLLYGDLIVKSPDNTSNNVIDIDREAISVNFGGYDYTSSSNPIASPTIGGKNAINRLIVDLQAGSSNFNNSVANSGSVITTKGGIKILPLQSGIGGSQGPAWGASLFLGEYGFGAYPTPVIARSQSTGDGKYRPGSGNVYCNAVRQNIVFSNNNNTSEGSIPWFPNTYQGNGTIFGSSMYYNGGDVRYIIIDPTNGVNGIATVTLPKISEPMLGQAITVARTTTPITFTNYQAAVFIKADSTDKINCPHSIYIDATSFSGIAIDPYSVIPNGGGSGYNLPNPYKANEICSVTLVASQNGYYNTVSSPTFGSSITNQYVWQFISSGGPGV